MGTASSMAYITRRSEFDTNMQFTIPWKCRDPTPSEIESMGSLNPKFGVSTIFDPIGVSGGCMPDATCVNGISQWTNVFGSVFLGKADPFLPPIDVVLLFH